MNSQKFTTEKQIHPTILEAMTKDGAELVEFLNGLHPVDAHLILRDNMPQDKIRQIEKNPDVQVVAKFKLIKKNAAKAYTESLQPVPRGQMEIILQGFAKQVFGEIAIRDNIICEMQMKINQLEEQCGMEMTSWQDPRSLRQQAELQQQIERNEQMGGEITLTPEQQASLEKAIQENQGANVEE